MFSTVYFALLSGFAHKNQLPAYAEAMLEGASERAYCLVDDVLERPAHKLVNSDDARLVAVADASLLLGYDQDAEEMYRRAQKLNVGEDGRLRVLSCRNAGWQLMMRDRYGATAKCFARIVHDEAASVADVLEAHIALALVHHQVGRQRDADDALLTAAELADTHEEPGWRLVIALLAREFDVQLRIRTATTLNDHAFWTSAHLARAQSAGDREEITRKLTEINILSPMPVLLVQRYEYLERLAMMANGERGVVSPLVELVSQPRHFRGSGQAFLAKIDIVLASLAGGLDDVADCVLAKISRDEADTGTRRFNFDYLYCVSKLAVWRGNPAEALKLYANYASEALRCLRCEAHGIGVTQSAASRALPADDISARLTVKYRRAYRYIIENLDRADLNTREIASHIDVTERALQLAFKRSIGMSPHALIRKLRLESIRNDLLNDERNQGSIFDTASRWGLKSRSALAKGYRREFNESPSETIQR
ncbi:helix-turn-helix transcriptional regulator [Burkholderia sp. MSMB1826]|uniref:helix-turn-helix transcriptional regulator n=1 Tax=Burkholderia sp. MSMB1826 TaxID=1637875 RepID=UPI0007C6366D|nr:helix-turn-helix transcriptional regulator [Burkholderia sp. MSMB1826]